VKSVVKKAWALCLSVFVVKGSGWGRAVEGNGPYRGGGSGVRLSMKKAER
jgi:hypothetical protein